MSKSFFYQCSLLPLVGVLCTAVWANSSHYIVQFESETAMQSTKQALSRTDNHNVRVLHSYKKALPGFVATLNDIDVKMLKNTTGVKRVVPDIQLPLQNVSAISLNARALQEKTRSPILPIPGSGNPVVDLIGANRVWSGAANNGQASLGEGVVVGFTGPGLVSSHPIFDETGEDGYAHVNPYGDGVYLGDCFSTPQHVCNNKLVGRYNFTSDPSVVAESLAGYGVELVSQAVGNRLTQKTLGDFGVPLVSGIAPHANVVSYRTCATSTCALSAVIQAFEQAIEDQVNILVNPIGSSGLGPWSGVLADAVLFMRHQGIVLSQSAGNSGPNPGTLSNGLAAPWVSIFVSSTHARSPMGKVIGEFTGGSVLPSRAMRGGSLSGAVSAPIVYAGDIPNPNSPGNEALCLAPYPDNMITGKILVCDRGKIARIQKALNAAESGAVGFVLANVEGDTDTIAEDIVPMPSIYLKSDDAQILKQWLSSGANHHASISANRLVSDSTLQDRVSPHNSRGPVLDYNYLMPTASIPALNVFSASYPESVALVIGTASAAGAGALALLESARPDWSDAQRISALMTTATAPLKEWDNINMSQPFTHGAGRVNLSEALNAGLLLDIDINDFSDANPSSGGHPEDLNIVGLINLDCADTCIWQRTLSATVADSWTGEIEVISGDAAVQVAPKTFTLQPGQEQAVTFKVQRSDVSTAPVYARVQLRPKSAAVSATFFEIYVE